MQNEKWLTASEVAAMIGMSERWVHKHRDSLPHYNMSDDPRGIRYKESEILDWLKSRKSEPAQAAS